MTTVRSETRVCQNCKAQFVVDASDFAFYEKIEVPPPTFCPQCRLQRRLVWRNEIAFHRRKCDMCGKEIIAMFPQGIVFPVYCRDCWWGDEWDGREYGQEYDWNKPFFQQFFELQQRVPAIALQVGNSVNCEFTNQIVNCKNCYLLNSADSVEDGYYSYRILNSKNIFDSSFLLKCENCYQCVECLGISYGAFNQNCADSLDLSFCYDARGSQNCFMSSNLRRVSYVFRNKRFSKEEYKKAMREIDIGSYRNVQIYEKEFQNLFKSSIHAWADMKNTVNTTGQIVTNAKDCSNCFTASDLENCHYSLYLTNAKDCMDIYQGCCTMERAYEVSAVGIKCANLKFSADVWPEVRDIMYCISCRNGSHDLFGCIGLKKAQYCILNKQYSKEEYEKLIPKIIQHMNDMPYIDKKGRVYKYGEFFPIELSHTTYNESPAQDYFSLTKEEAVAKGYPWRDEKDRNLKITKNAGDLPNHIKDTDDSILSEIIGCAHRGKCNERCTIGFRIIPAELQFHRAKNLALPRLCPNCRNYARLRRQNPINLWKRKCMCQGGASIQQPVASFQYKNRTSHLHGASPCPNEFETSYPPDREEIIYCESCYHNEVV